MDQRKGEMTGSSESGGGGGVGGGGGGGEGRSLGAPPGEDGKPAK